MRILMATNYQPPHMGGIEYAAGSLKRCWEESGHRVTWITTDIPRGGAPSAPDNIRIPALNTFETLFQINSPLIHPLYLRKIENEAREHDVINVHSLAPGLSSAVLRTALKHRRPAVVTQHVGVIPLKIPLLNVVQEKAICSAARNLVRKGGLLTFVGKAVREWFLAHAHLPENRVFMTPAGIDHHDYFFVNDGERGAFRKKWDLDRSPFNVLFVGRFYEKKGLPLLRQITRHCPDLHFTFVGSGPISPSAWNLPNVRVIPRVSTAELRELYGAHNLFIMPSIGEGWPAVVPQAMACGLACMISPETFDGYGRDADRFLVRPRDAETIAASLKELAVERGSLLTRRKELSDYAVDTWDWKRTAEIYLGLFEKLQTGR